MKINVVIVTTVDEIRDYVAEKRDGIIPASSKSLAYYAERRAIFSVFGFMPARDRGFNDFDDFVLSLPESDGILIICEEALLHVARHLDTAVFVFRFELRAGAVNAQNVLAKPIAKILKDFVVYSRFFDNMKTRKILLLPLKNFRAAEIGRLIDLFSSQSDRERFGEALEAVMSAFRDRQTPKQPKTRPEVYLKDDDDKFFIYGPERHSLPDTAIPPHSKLCVLAQSRRFGRLYDRELHYNVSRQPNDSDIQGAFPDCHGVNQTVRPTSHINMFPNDFMTWPER